MTVDVKAAPDYAGAKGFAGQVVLVVNAHEDVGAQIGRAFAARGAAIGLCGSDAKHLDLLASEIVAAGGRAIAVPAGTAADVVARVQAQFGKVDVLVNRPGTATDGPVSHLAVSDFSTNVETMLTSSFAFMREVLPGMRARHYGRIVGVYDIAYLGLPAHPSVAAAHAGLFGLTRSLALEVAAEGVTVNAVVQGDIAPAGLPPDEADKLGGRVPVKRVGTPADVLHAVDFFASSASVYVTGQTLFVCGGKSAYFSMSV